MITINVPGITYYNKCSCCVCKIRAIRIQHECDVLARASANTVFQGNTYQDPGAEITDANNISYDDITSATTLDTLILGAQNITYSAPADAAGNVPDSITRTVTVLAKPLGIVTLTIEGNNTANSTKYTKLDDQITLNLTANGTIGHAVINITNTSNAYTTDNNNISVSYTLDDSFKDANGVVFNITVYNEDNTTLTVFTQDDLTNTNLIIDSTQPNITLNGNSTITVYTNTNFDDENATAYDLSYGNIAITGTGTINTAIATSNSKSGDVNRRCILHYESSSYSRTCITSIVIWCCIV